MINFSFATFAKLVLAFFLGLSQSTVRPAAVPASMLSLGDKIDGMTLSAGAGDARPLWAFCSSSAEGKGSYTLDCRVPVQSSLGIGNIFLYDGESIANQDWSGLVWQLSVDGKEVDLASFGTFDSILPIMCTSPASTQEASKRGTAWNIALTDLQPGHHTLWFAAQSNIESYTWFVNLDVVPGDATNISSIPFPIHI